MVWAKSSLSAPGVLLFGTRSDLLSGGRFQNSALKGGQPETLSGEAETIMLPHGSSGPSSFSAPVGRPYYPVNNSSDYIVMRYSYLAGLYSEAPTMLHGSSGSCGREAGPSACHCEAGSYDPGCLQRTLNQCEGLRKCLQISGAIEPEEIRKVLCICAQRTRAVAAQNLLFVY